MRTRFSLLSLAVIVSVLTTARRAAADEVAHTTPHPSLVMGVVDDLLGASAIVGGLYYATQGKPGAAALLTPGIAVATQGVISTIHGAVDRRALRNPAAAAAGHALVTGGNILAMTGVGFIITDALAGPSGESFGSFMGVVLMPCSVLLLAPGIPLLVYGERSVEGAQAASPEAGPQIRVVGGPGQLSVVGTF